MSQPIKSFFLATLLFFFTNSLASAELRDDWLKLGVVPYKSPRALVELYSPVAAQLSKVLGKNVQVVTAVGFDQYLQRIYDKQYDIIALGSTFYFKAHDLAGYKAVGRGYPPFYCGLIVRKNSAIHDIEELRGKRLAAVNIMDRGGYKIQKQALYAKGIHVDTDLEVHYRGSHDSVVYAVLNGQDDAGAIRLDILQKDAFVKVRDELRIIYTSAENPQFPFAVRADMDPLLKDKIGESLTSITMAAPETTEILRNLNIQGFERISSKELELLRQQRQEEDQRLGMP